MNTLSYKCSKIPSKHVFEVLDEYITYQPEDIGFSHIDGNGKGVKICIIDSGYPSHHSINVPASHTVDFTDNGSSLDVHGHGTAIAGLIKSNGFVTGLAVASEVFYIKALNDYGIGTHGSVQAAILYSIVKKADIIVMSFGSDSGHSSLHDVIKKAYRNNICIFAASGNSLLKTKDAEYPARFPEVMSIGIENSGKNKLNNSNNYSINFSNKYFYSLYPSNKYVKINGSSMFNAYASGVGARIIQRMKEKENKVDPKTVYEQMISLFSKR